MYSEANSQRNTDFGETRAEKKIVLPRSDEHEPFRRKQEIVLHVELVCFIW